jgi:hypothetical protein
MGRLGVGLIRDGSNGEGAPSCGQHASGLDPRQRSLGENSGDKLCA